MEFTYVNIVAQSCEGWLNLFFKDEVIALIDNVAIADEIRKTCKERKQNAE